LGPQTCPSIHRLHVRALPRREHCGACLSLQVLPGQWAVLAVTLLVKLLTCWSHLGVGLTLVRRPWFLAHKRERKHHLVFDAAATT
jgi:hypothetical protein